MKKIETIISKQEHGHRDEYLKGHRESVFCPTGVSSCTEHQTERTTAVADPFCHSEVCSPTFREIADLWLKSKKIRTKISTYNKYTNILSGYVLPYIGDIHIQAISVPCIAQLCDTLLTSGGRQGAGLSEKTVADTISVIRSVIQYAVNMGCSCSLDLRSVRVRRQVRELRILSRKDQQALYSYLCKNPSYYNNVGILICILTGLRIGEVCALRWEDISFSDHTMYVHQAVQRIQDDSASGRKTSVVITSPKSVSGKRVIPIPQNLEAVLLNMDSGKSGFVVSKDGIHLTEPRVLQYHFKKVLKELGIEEVNFHILRHTFATRCVELGFDVKSLSEILGHASVSITMNKYVHPSMALKHENMQRLSSFFSEK